MKTMKIYKAHILYTREKDRFEVLEDGYIALGDDGRVTAVADHLPTLDGADVEVTDILVLSLPCLNREGSAYYFLAIHDVNAARKPI